MTSMTAAPIGVTGGVDTHRDSHMAAALDHLGRVTGVAQFPATAHGYRRLLGWLQAFGSVVRVGVEGTGVWGAGLSRFLTAQGVTVIEVDRPDRQQRRRQGKSDPTDAIAAARAVLADHATVAPKTADGGVESIRMLRVARSSAMKARTQAANQLHAIVVTAPEALRARLRHLSTVALVDHASRFRPGTNLGDPHAAAKLALRTLARRWQQLSAEVDELDRHLEDLVTQAAPHGLLELHGVSTDVAGALLVAAGDNPQRLRSDASFAALCGVSPIEASSGPIVRHRLNRGGNRAANNALWRVVLVRMRWDQHTRDYVARRTAEGKTKREIIRCLKRYVAREIYRTLRVRTTTDVPIAPTA